MNDKKTDQPRTTRPIFVNLKEASPQTKSGKSIMPSRDSARLFSAAPSEDLQPVVWKRLVASPDSEAAIEAGQQPSGLKTLGL